MFYTYLLLENKTIQNIFCKQIASLKSFFSIFLSLSLFLSFFLSYLHICAFVRKDHEIQTWNSAKFTLMACKYKFFSLYCDYSVERVTENVDSCKYQYTSENDFTTSEDVITTGSPATWYMLFDERKPQTASKFS